MFSPDRFWIGTHWSRVFSIGPGRCQFSRRHGGGFFRRGTDPYNPRRRPILHPHPDNAGAPAAVSSWIRERAALIPAGGDVLDLACGSGRHSRYLAARGFRVLAVDRDAQALAGLRGIDGVETLEADLEGAPWPLAGRLFAGVVVTNYLHRPLLPSIVDAVGAGGVLLYETFAKGNERFGKPSNPDFLLRPGELLQAVEGRLRVIAYEDLQVEQPRPAMVQRVCAVRETGAP